MAEGSTLSIASGNLSLNSFNFKGENTTLLSGGFLRSFIIPNFIKLNFTKISAFR